VYIEGLLFCCCALLTSDLKGGEKGRGWKGNKKEERNGDGERKGMGGEGKGNEKKKEGKGTGEERKERGAED